MKKIKTLKEVNLAGKKVLLRVDFNVPIDKKTGAVLNNARIVAALPTINHLIKQGARIIVMSHLGRPEGKRVPLLALDKVAKELSKLLKKPVKKVDDCFGPAVEKQLDTLKNGELMMLENVRFYAEEEENDEKFTKSLAALGDVFVSDAFGVVHRAHASTAGISVYLPSYAGFLLQKEVEVLSDLMQNPKKPLTVIVGGSKIDTKIGILKGFLKIADNFLIGGGLANTFLAAAGYDIGASLYERDKLEIAREIMLLVDKAKVKFIIPHDVITASEISDKAETLAMPVQDVEGDMKILDMGPMTLARFHQILEKSKTVIWNGPVGLFECKPFANGTKVIAQELAKSKAMTIIGGGDTVEALEKLGISLDKFTHISTGGGAMLEFLEGKKLPGVECLRK